MRITRGQLHDLINEEITSALLERQNSRLLEASVDPVDSTGPMSLDDLMRFAKQYARLSMSDRQNLVFLVSGRGENVTPGEIEDLQAMLKGFHKELDDLFEESLEASAMYSDEDEDDGTWAAAVRANR